MQQVMRKPLAIVGAPSSIGIRPYDHSGEPRRVASAPGVLRELGLTRRLNAEDASDVMPPPYRDFVRPPSRARNEEEVATYSHALSVQVAGCISDGRFTLVLGGDCSIVLGCLLAANHAAGRVGLVYCDAHADFATSNESQTGSVASMCLALAVGHGESPLAHLAGQAPLVQAEDVALVGRRDLNEPSYGHAALGRSGILDLPDTGYWPTGGMDVVSAVTARVCQEGIRGFWIHVDADLLDPRLMVAVDSPEPGGPSFDELAVFLAPLVSHPLALGMQLTLYDPALDPDRTCGTQLIAMLEQLLGAQANGESS